MVAASPLTGRLSAGAIIPAAFEESMDAAPALNDTGLARSGEGEAPATTRPDPRDRRGPFRPDRLATVRERLSGPTLTRLFRTVDAIALSAIALVVAAWNAPTGLLSEPLGAVLPLILSPVLTLCCLFWTRAYGLSARESLKRHLTRVAASALVGGLAGMATATLTGHGALELALFNAAAGLVAATPTSGPGPRCAAGAARDG